MPRPHPNPLVLFSLHPYNQNTLAKSAIAHSKNVNFASTDHNGLPVLSVGFYIFRKSSTALATLGHGPEVDIYLEEPIISRLQCSFEIDSDNGVIMFFDRSHGCTSQVSGTKSEPFEQGRIRKVLVQDGFNTVIALGEGSGLYEFELEWHQDPIETAKLIELHSAVPGGRVMNPRVADTVPPTPNFSQFQLQKRSQNNEQQPFKIRFVKSSPELGSGSFGRVYRAVDVDTGKVMAVKILIKPTIASNQEEWGKSESNALKREVDYLSQIQHPNIVDYIGSQGWFGSQIEIFMGLKEGTLASLVLTGRNEDAIAGRAYQHTLQALDFIACKGMVHRDVKPENILYITQPGGHFQFQLGDFGLCNRAVNAVSRAGTMIYMAPEISSGRRGTQTHKVDVWSLFVTIVWTLNAGGFRQQLMTTNRFRDEAEVHEEMVRIAATERRASDLREMAIIDPSQRASAAQMLVKHFGGEGLTTERNQVSDLPNCGPCSFVSDTVTTAIAINRRGPIPPPIPAISFRNHQTTALQNVPVQTKPERRGAISLTNAHVNANANRVQSLLAAAIAASATAAIPNPNQNPNPSLNTHTRAYLSAAATAAAPNPVPNSNRVRKSRDVAPAAPARNIPVLRPLESRLKMAQRKAD